ncbi:MAG: DUF4846 domain-containing protein [Bacteroidales bacterium]|nr:DUF4846 domain-containing protein [Bacteroidales bacterium]
MTLCERFMPPAGFSRVGEDPGSFGAYLRGLPLKPHGEKVRYYHGGLKNSTSVYAAVVDLPIGNRDLHQCADAVMRLRAEYLYMVQDYDAIHFNFTNGFRVDYSEWIKGNRIVVRGNNVSWVHSARPSIEYPEFWKYMEVIFTYAGTLSLSKEMTRVPAQEMQIGDVFIQGGSPGHAIIVVDMAENPDTGERLFMLAQSYMPAQEIQVLENPVDAAISPWYPLDFGEVLYTPEWTFRRDDLKRFAR